jgi:hypothetical protein
MKRIEVKLSLEVVAPLLDVIKAAGDTLRAEPAAALPLEQLDPGLRDAWREELVAGQTEDVATLLALFDSDFFATGVVTFDADNAEPILRAAAAVRLRLREGPLAPLADEILESGEVGLEALAPPLRRAFLCYLFLATLQELIIEHLDTSILGRE